MHRPLVDAFVEVEEALEQEKKANDMLVIERDDLQDMVEQLRTECSALDIANCQLTEEITCWVNSDA